MWNHDGFPPWWAEKQWGSVGNGDGVRKAAFGPLNCSLALLFQPCEFPRILKCRNSLALYKTNFTDYFDIFITLKFSF